MPRALRPLRTGRRPSSRCRWIPVLALSAACLRAGVAADAPRQATPNDSAPGIGVGRVTRVADDSALRRALDAARPGDLILVEPGDYRGFSARGVRGVEGAPIILRAADEQRPPRFTGTVHFIAPSDLTLDSLLFEGSPANGLNIDDGGMLDAPARGITLRRLVVRACGGRGNHDGIKLSGVVDSLIESCVIERWGRQGSAIDMVGCARIRIEGCTVRDSEENPAASGIQAKGGSRAIVIRRCRFEHAGQRAVNIGGSTGRAYFRPRPEGFEAKEIVVEGCTFVGSMAPIAFVGVDGAVVRFNTLHRPRRWVLRILQETRDQDFVPCRDGVFSDNLVVFRASEIASAVNIGPGTSPESFRFARNHWYAMDDPARSRPHLPTPEVDGSAGVDPLLQNPDAGDFGVRDASPARTRGAHALPHDAGAGAAAGPPRARD